LISLLDGGAQDVTASSDVVFVTDARVGTSSARTSNRLPVPTPVAQQVERTTPLGEQNANGEIRSLGSSHPGHST